jgi:hypothetical protein
MNEQLKWLLKIALTTVSLVSLIETGRRHGWL